MKIKTESDGKCLNCRSNLQIDDQFCPRCGQKIDRNDLRLRAVISEFIENYLSFDSRLGRSLIPFFFKPGFLAQQFIQGVRRNYANPFRLYIFTSLFFFFCLNAYLSDSNDFDNVVDISGTNLRSFDDLSESAINELEPKLSDEIIESLNQSGQKSFKKALYQQKGIYKREVLAVLNDSIIEKLAINKDSLLSQSNVEVSLNSKNEGMTMDFDLHKIRPYMDDPNYNNEMLYDSLTLGKEIGFWEEVILKRMIKIERADDREVSRYILSNLSLGMFVLIPLYALLMKLFYFRRNKYYVAHLIHAIYLQSFAFLLFGAIIFIRWFEWIGGESYYFLLRLCALVFGVYFIASFRRIYRQSWLKLLGKSFLLIIGYFILMAIVFIGEVLVSFLLF